MTLFTGKHILITGGTGSLGKTLVKRLLVGDDGEPERIIVFSRDEAKQHQMRLDFSNRRNQTEEILYENFHRRLQFHIGDVRDYDSVAMALQGVDIVINAAALKQVPTCEYFPYEAVRTNVHGPANIVNAIVRNRLPVETVVGVSTDKAVSPINVMGMTKALQERLFISSQLALHNTRVVIVRYGNVMASRGSVIPLFHHQILNGGPVTLTDTGMTRFLFTLSDAVDTIFEAIRSAHPGEIYVPLIPSGHITDVAHALIGDRNIEVVITGIRPGEKIHELLISSEESPRVEKRNSYYCIRSLLPEVAAAGPGLSTDLWEYSSGAAPGTYEEVRGLLEARGLLDLTSTASGEELLR
jgi:FlaA1/EpsC-like NDP-sugar epimerase